jgi:hypothetical protein
LGVTLTGICSCCLFFRASFFSIAKNGSNFIDFSVRIPWLKKPSEHKTT